MKSTVDVVPQGIPTLLTIGSDGLINITGFRDEILGIAKRGAATIRTMETGGYPPQRIEQERLALRREVLDLRIKVTQQFGDRLTVLIRDAGLQ